MPGHGSEPGRRAGGIRRRPRRGRGTAAREPGPALAAAGPRPLPCSAIIVAGTVQATTDLDQNSNETRLSRRRPQALTECHWQSESQ